MEFSEEDNRFGQQGRIFLMALTPYYFRFFPLILMTVAIHVDMSISVALSPKPSLPPQLIHLYPSIPGATGTGMLRYEKTS